MDDSGITLYKLRVLCEVVEARSFTAAAERLFTTQPALSVHMRSLERFFGARLVRQEGRQTVPTEPGRAAYRYAKEVLRETASARQLVSDVAGGEAGEVSIGASEAIGNYQLPRPLVEFVRRFPRAVLTLATGPTSQVAADTLGGLNDLSVLELVPALPDGLATEPLFSEPVVIVVGPEHPRAGTSIDPLELGHESMVTRPPGNHSRAQLEWRLAEIGVEVRPAALQLSSVEAVKRAVRHGAGLAALLECEVAEELEMGTLAEVFVPELDLSQPFALAFRRNKRFSPMARRLVEHLRAQLTT